MNSSLITKEFPMGPEKMHSENLCMHKFKVTSVKSC